MAVNFNQNSAWNLKPISVDAVRSEVNGFLINGEEIVAAFQTVRDQLLFTSKRIIAIDVQGITGKKNRIVPCLILKCSIFLYKHLALLS